MFEVRTGTEILADHISYVFKKDKEALDAYLKGRGWRYIAGAVCIFPITLLKAFLEFVSTSSWCFKRPIAEKEMRGVGLSSINLKDMARNVRINNLEGFNREGISEVHDFEETSSTDACMALREQLEHTNYKLKGTIIRTTFPKITGEELLASVQEGKLEKPFIVQRVTFGNDTNKLLKLLFNSLKLRKVRGQEDTYIVLEGNEVLELEVKLSELFMKNVTVILRKKVSE